MDSGPLFFFFGRSLPGRPQARTDQAGRLAARRLSSAAWTAFHPGCYAFSSRAATQICTSCPQLCARLARIPHRAGLRLRAAMLTPHPASTVAADVPRRRPSLVPHQPDTAGGLEQAQTRRWRKSAWGSCAGGFRRSCCGSSGSPTQLARPRPTTSMPLAWPRCVSRPPAPARLAQPVSSLTLGLHQLLHARRSESRRTSEAL